VCVCVIFPLVLVRGTQPWGLPKHLRCSLYAQNVTSKEKLRTSIQEETYTYVPL